LRHVLKHELAHLRRHDILLNWLAAGLQTWRTADETRPDYVPGGSWPDERGRIQDKTDYPFVDDPAVVGVWTTADFVEAIDDFDPAERRFQGSGYLRRLEFVGQGQMKSQFEDDPLRPAQRMRWTSGLWLWRCPHEHTASEYVIKSIDGIDYLFLEWKSGDYTIRHAKPGYYVLRRAD
jgi:bla regulator protein BlaR1